MTEAQLEKYECEGQMSIFDLYKELPHEPKCKSASECDAYPIGCGGTINLCRFGGLIKWHK